MRVGPSSPTAPRSCPSMQTGATTTAHDDSGSKPCSVPMATESPRSRTSRRRVTTTSCCSRMARTERTVSTASNDSASRAGPPTKTWSVSMPPSRESKAMCAAVTSWSTATDPLDGPAQERGEKRAGSGQHLLRRLGLEVDGPLLDGAVGEHHDQKRVLRREADELDGAESGRVVGGTDDHGGVGGQLGEQARGPLEHGLHLTVDLLEELPHLAALSGAEHAGSGQVVDEEAVALVGRDAAGTRMWLDEVPLAFERHHLRADGGRGHLHARCVGHMGGPDRLGGPDVLGDDSLHDGGPACAEGAPALRHVGERGGGSGRGHGGPGTQVYRVPGRQPWAAPGTPGDGMTGRDPGFSRHPGAMRR